VSEGSTAGPVLVLGAGDVGSAIAHALFTAGFNVALQDGPSPPATPRRGMAFADAFFDEEASLAGVVARRADTPGSLPAIWAAHSLIPFLTSEVEEALTVERWSGVVDARMRKRAIPEDLRRAAPLALGLGPGFVAGTNCHVAIETSWEALGKVVAVGATLPLRGEPNPIGGAGRERTIYAAGDGVFRTTHKIGDHVSSDPVGTLGGTPVPAPMPGVLRGLVRDGVRVRAGAKLVEVDPRGDPALCFGLGERPKRIAAAVLGVLTPTTP
jgi:xanthine dehydrogenase accessory factor